MAKKKKQQKVDKGTIILVIFLCIIVSFVAFVKLISENAWLLFPLIIIGVSFASYKVIVKKKSKEAILQKKIKELERTSTIGGLFNEFASNPQGFEKYIADLYTQLGYEAYVTKGSNDGGKDVVMNKDGKKYVVEVKLYATNNKIGRERIQKLHSAMIDENANGAIYITTSDFTTPAREYAEKFGIELITSNELVGIINCVKTKLLEQNNDS